MSELKANFQEDIANAALLEKKRAEIQNLELEVREHKALAAKTRIDESHKNIELAKTTNFGSMSEDRINKLVLENTAYIESAQHSHSFIDPGTFKDIVPFFRKNLIFIGAKTGEGKSTAVANIVLQLISELNPVSKSHKRVLVITNEEKAEDFYNRITCLIKGWHYVNHNKFTTEQLKVFNDYIKLLSKLVTVVDDTYTGGSGCTTSVEGIEMIFDNCIRDGIFYDAVLIDYYQNVTYSQKDTSLDEYKSQALLCTSLDSYKNIYPAPIVVFGQITPAEEGKETSKPFEYRIKGRKQILVPSTFAMEMVAERSMLRTAWVIHKGRFAEEIGKTLYTGYNKGRFVTYDQSFKQHAMKIIEEKAKQAMNRAGGGFLDPKKGAKDAEVQKKAD